MFATVETDRDYAALLKWIADTASESELLNASANEPAHSQ
jgi:hypothetical protein